MSIRIQSTVYLVPTDKNVHCYPELERPIVGSIATVSKNYIHVTIPGHGNTKKFEHFKRIQPDGEIPLENDDWTLYWTEEQWVQSGPTSKQIEIIRQAVQRPMTARQAAIINAALYEAGLL